jgi:predicted MPP superfamily phosphohydrolase
MTHTIPDLVLTIAIAIAQVLGLRMMLSGPARSASPTARRWIVSAVGAYLGLLLLCHVSILGAENWLPRFFTGWVRAAVLIWGVLSVCWIAIYKLTKLLPSDPNPARRRFLVAAKTALFGVPAVAAGYGVFIQRFRLTLREQKIVIPNLPAGLNGLRIVQVTDIHRSPFLSEKELAQAIALANETKAHLALITGDLISAKHDPLDECLKQVAGLRADLGIYGCMGNHERYAEAQDYTESEGAKLGVCFLRNSAAKLDFGGASLNLVGVDYQQSSRPYLLGTENLIDPTAFNVLLSHNPDVFPVAARKGFPLTIAGHTHGGQVRVEILEQDLNVARFFTPYVDGLYQQGGSSIFVSRGIGTIGVPARLGAPPEVALLTLTAHNAAGRDNSSRTRSAPRAVRS